MCKFRTLNDSPVTLGQWEKAENVYDYEYNFEKNASEEEVEAMHNHESAESPMPYRKKKAITKIFRHSSYLPSLDDIEEGFEEESAVAEDYVASSEEEYDLSLSAIHQERAWRYCSRPKFDIPRSRPRHHKHRHRSDHSETSESGKRRRRRHKMDSLMTNNT